MWGADLDKWAKLSPRKRWADIDLKWLGRYGPNIFFLLFLVGPNQVRPTSKVNYFAETWTVTVHVLHATKWLQTGGGEDYQGQWSRPWSRGWVDNSGGVAARNGGGSWRSVVAEGREKENLQRRERERASVAPGGRKVVVLASCGGVGGWKSDGDDSGGWDGGEKRESEDRRQKRKNSREEGWFSADFGHFPSFRSWNAPLFIGGGRETFCL